MMNTAVCCICPDRKQRAHLALVWHTWQAYAKRHGMTLHVIERPPCAEHVYWGKYFVLDMPALDRYDAALVIDNDVLISPASPSMIETWNPALVGMVDERAQFGWSRDYVDRYFAHYDLTVPDGIAEPAILNSGVLIYAREHLAAFHTIYESWRGWRSDPLQTATRTEVFKYANDQAHVGLALQTARLTQRLDPKFNRLWWSWWQDGGRRSEWPLKIYARSLQILTRWLPRTLTDPVAAPGLRWLDQAVRDNYFLHFAGSKSPLHLLAHRPPSASMPE